MVQRIDPTETGMANIALGHLRKPRINTIDEQSKPANEIRRHFAAVRDGLQAQYPWNFCEGMAALTADAAPPLARFRYAYGLPADCLTVRELIARGEAPFKVVAGHRLTTDCAPPLIVRYTKSVPEVGYWSALFRNAFCLHLAVAAGGVLADDETLLAQLKQQATNSLATAFPVDAAEGTPDTMPDTAWVRCR